MNSSSDVPDGHTYVIAYPSVRVVKIGQSVYYAERVEQAVRHSPVPAELEGVYRLGPLRCYLSCDASAKCGTGNPASYDDIEAVLFGQKLLQWAGADDYPLTVPSLAESTYYVFFWESSGEKFPTVYSQFDLKGGRILDIRAARRCTRPECH